MKKTQMPTHKRIMMMALGLAVLLGPAAHAQAQADAQNFMFNSGQSMQPFFDGWARNPDGSFEFHFGYLNRNYVEELHIPVGANNHITPDAPDQGQPDYFYPRKRTRVFSVTVPADWGDREVVWQVTVGEDTHRAVGWLQPEWEIDANPGAMRTDPSVLAVNDTPTLSVSAPASAAVGGAFALTVNVSDDGLPPPRVFRGGGQGVLPTFERVPGPTLPINVPRAHARNRHAPTRSEVDGITVMLTQLRGPVGARLQAERNVEGGVATVTGTFAHAGTYLFRVTASDGPSSATQDVSLTVR